jgi:hypothetical protein
MRAVRLRVRAADLSREMARMRIWLDERRIGPTQFGYDRNTAGIVLVTVTFAADDDAAAFAAEFGGSLT